MFDQQGGRVDPDVLSAREGLLGTTSPSAMVDAALDGWRRQMVEEGRDLLQGALDLARSVREEIAGIDGLHVSDHRRISAQLSYADEEATTRPLLTALRHLVQEAARADGELDRAGEVAMPTPEELRLELVHLPRDAFFGRTEQVPLDRAAGRVTAETLTPYPPGIPAVLLANASPRRSWTTCARASARAWSSPARPTRGWRASGSTGSRDRPDPCSAPEHGHVDRKDPPAVAVARSPPSVPRASYAKCPPHGEARHPLGSLAFRDSTAGVFAGRISDSWPTPAREA